MNLDQAIKLADQDCPLPSLAGPALKVLRERVRELEGKQAARVEMDTEGKQQWDELAGIIGANGDDVDDVFAKARALVQPAPERQGADKHAQGLYQKFRVQRTDGSDQPGGKHDGCDYFVLDMTHDPFAKPAAAAYATACEAEYPLLAADMRKRYGLTAAPVGVPDGWREALSDAMNYANSPAEGHDDGMLLLDLNERVDRLLAAAPSAPQVDA